MRIEAGKSYFGATREGVLRVVPNAAVQVRGVVKHWDCLNKDFDPDKPEIERFIALGRKQIFATHEEAHKAVFQIKLKVA